MQHRGPGRWLAHLGALAAQVAGIFLLLLTHEPGWYWLVGLGKLGELVLALRDNPLMRGKGD